MKIFKKISALVLVLSVCALWGCQSEPETVITAPAVTGNMEFEIFKAGQADAIVMHTENHNVIIDCGEADDGDEILEYFTEKGITNADYIFITHFDKDHVGGFPEVIENITADNIIVPSYEGNNDEYENAQYSKPRYSCRHYGSLQCTASDV